MQLKEESDEHPSTLAWVGGRVLGLSVVPLQAANPSHAARGDAARIVARAPSPDGQVVAYVTGGRLYVRPITGGLARKLVTPWPVYQLHQTGAEKAIPAGKVSTVSGNERTVPRRSVTQAMLQISVQNNGPVAATYQAVVTYQHTHYTLPIPQAAYPVEYLAKSPETRIAAGQQGTFMVDFLIGGSGTPPSDGASGQIDILAQADGLTYLVAKQRFTWQPHAS